MFSKKNITSLPKWHDFQPSHGDFKLIGPKTWACGGAHVDRKSQKQLNSSERQRTSEKLTQQLKHEGFCKKERKKLDSSSFKASQPGRKVSELQRTPLQGKSIAVGKPNNGKKSRKGACLDGFSPVKGNCDGARQFPSNKHVDTHSPHKAIPFSSPTTEDQPNAEKTVNTNLTVRDVPSLLDCPTSQAPSASEGFNDKLAVTAGTAELDTDGLATTISDLCLPSNEHATLAPKQMGKTAYAENYEIVSSEGKHLSILQFRPNNSDVGFFRLELNPKAIGPDGAAQLRQVLHVLFGEHFRTLLGEGRITRLDATVDVKGQQLGDLIIFTANALSSSQWIRNFSINGVESWRLRTQYLGAMDSAHQVCVYDKGYQLWEVKGCLSKGPLTRIEARYRPAKGGKPGSVGEVLTASNPFSRINLANYPSSNMADSWFEFFLCGVREWGAAAALNKLKDKNRRVLYRRHLADYCPDWWQPDHHWSQVLAHIQSLDLFPKEIFKKKLRLEPDE